ncbi:hypothetical protein COO59_13405 [Mixta theicola]|uniref:Colicin V synthesis protein n=2 Tax=Mixta theicola TaxID=1458355 RepID=A0A2K1Q8F3_9GAMM|nr:hypothetical protein COO59_13405 [Mixta theicola]GLR07471.1 hypothetical protein GCM10007905_01900 [Mixta theicola]
MRHLTLSEVNQVSGGDFFEMVGAIIIGSVAGASSGILKAGTVGGNSGGILGAGIFGGAGGALIGAITGGVQGALYGMINSWDKTLEWFNNTAEQWFDMISPLPK